MTKMPNSVTELFEGANYAHIATVLPSGAPHSVPIWVGIERDMVAFFTSATSRKARNIATDPRVSVSVTDRDEPFAMAQVQGRVVEQLDNQEAWEIIDRISVKYTGSAYAVRTDRVVYLVAAERCWVRPRELGWDASKGGASTT